MKVVCFNCQAENPETSLFCADCGAKLRPVDDAQASNSHSNVSNISKTILADKYRILEKLGEGGMGIVYKAEDLKLKREVAIKLLPPELTKDIEARDRFLREAQAAASLNHPQICTIYEVDETDNRIFISMEFIEGQSLKDKLKQGPFSIDQAKDIAVQVAEGLKEAHKKGIVHRDIKPANIMMTKDGLAKIVDFGLAKLFEGTVATRTASVMGTVAYMSPEQALGESIDHRTDLWSLGVVLYEILTGDIPFSGEHMGTVIHSILNKYPEPPSEIKRDIPSDLERIILKCLRKSAKDRYQSAQELLSDLTNLKEREGRETQSYEEVYKETERRQATVMFVDVLGYEELKIRIDPEEAASIMNSCFGILSSIVEKHGGRKPRVMGSRLWTIFGIPVVVENAPMEAVKAAIEMSNELHKFNSMKQMEFPLDIQFGINTGTVIAGPLGPDGKEYSVAGAAVDLAAQILDIAEKGKIYVGPLTQRYTFDCFVYKKLKPVSLKGEKKPVSLYELLSTKEKLQRELVISDRMIHSEMVGRNKELNKLELHVFKVINDEGSIVNVIGEAGIGKSRLVTELLKKDAIKNVKCLRGRALSFGKNLSYYPIVNILKSWANIKEEDSESESSFKIEETIRRIYPDGVEEVYPFIATLMGMKLSGKHADRIRGVEGDAMEKLILKNIREMIIKQANIRPLVLILEDLHWADLSSIELLESLYRMASNNRILFINIFRPNYKHTSERILESIKERCHGYHSEIYLEPLDEKQCNLLIQNLMKASGIPEDIRRAIANRAEGNPFFIEEVLRSFIDEGVVELRGGKFKITEKIDSVIIPETIKEVIMTRIDRLDENAKSLLKEASVIGRYFFYKILNEVTNNPVGIDDKLEYLQRIQLIQRRKRLEEIEYLFKHALAHEATYDSLLLKKRKELHIKVAKAIESIFINKLHEFYGMLAFHYSRGDEMDKAEEYLLKAGEEALKAAASYEALSYFKDALELYRRKLGDAADPEKIAGLNKKIGIALYFKGHLAEAVEHFDKALEYWEGKRPKSKIKGHLRLLVGLLWIMKEIHFPSKKRKGTPGKRENEVIESSYRKQTALVPIDTHRMFTEAIGLFKRVVKFDLTEVKHGVAFVSGFSALFSYSGVSLKVGKKILDYTKGYLSRSDDKSIFAYNYWKLVYEYLSGEWDSEQDFDEKLIDDMVIRGEAWNATGFITILGFIKIELGDFGAATKCCNKLRDIADVYEDDYSKVRNYYVYTRQLLRSGKLREVVNEANRGVPFITKVNQPLAVIFLLGMKANAQILLKEMEAAESSLLAAKELVSREKRVSPLMISSYLTSEFLFSLFMLVEAKKTGDKLKIRKYRKSAFHFGKAALKNSEKYAAEKTKILRLMGVYSWITGKHDKAFTWFERSIKVGKKLNALPELSRAYLISGKMMLKEKRNDIKAEEYLEKARQIFAELDIDSDLEEASMIIG